MENQSFADISGCVDTFQKRAVCPKCHSLYAFAECIQGSNTINVCSHRFKQGYRRCASPLMKMIVSSCSGHTKYYPHSVYCFSSLISSLQTLILRPGFVEQLESTRNCLQSTGLHDVYNGLIWKEFMTYSGTNFLSTEYNYAILLNVDWLQPFVHITYSVGIVYAVILNLPRLIRFKRENVILLLGVIPGPSEPPLTINSYLAPIVADLLELWKGVKMKLAHSSVTIRCALIGVSCDLPAARKVCGFLSHSANLGCSMCYAEFSEGFGSRNYSNFDRSQWKLRSNAQHRSDVEKIQKAKTKTEQSKLVTKYGCRYSALLDLPYFDPVRMLLVDPMHNLFLGSAKHVTLDILVGRAILSSQDLAKIEQRLKNIQVPVGLGRLPTRIDTGKFLTAEQWKNWTIHFSIYCLHDLIPADQLECWRHFVLACRRLCKYSVTSTDLAIADGLLVQFCKRLCRIYGANALTPNCHMHCHLVTCIKNFGPLHSFWLFPFERYNGILGDQPNNNRSVELQFMRRFQKDNNHLQMIDQVKTWPDADTFLELTPFSSSLESSQDISSSMRDTEVAVLGSKSTLCTLSAELLVVLKRLYSELYPAYSAEILNGQIYIPTMYRKYSYIIWKGHRLHSVCCKGSNNPYILATPLFKFTTSTSTINAISCTESVARPAQLQYFLSHSISLSGSEKSHILAHCLWPMEHPRKSSIGKPVEIWCKELYEPAVANTIVPVSTFSSHVIISTDIISNDHVLVTIPL